MAADLVEIANLHTAMSGPMMVKGHVLGVSPPITRKVGSNPQVAIFLADTTGFTVAVTNPKVPPEKVLASCEEGSCITIFNPKLRMAMREHHHVCGDAMLEITAQTSITPLHPGFPIGSLNISNVLDPVPAALSDYNGDGDRAFHLAGYITAVYPPHGKTPETTSRLVRVTSNVSSIGAKLFNPFHTAADGVNPAADVPIVVLSARMTTDNKGYINAKAGGFSLVMTGEKALQYFPDYTSQVLRPNVAGNLQSDRSLTFADLKKMEAKPATHKDRAVAGVVRLDYISSGQQDIAYEACQHPVPRTGSDGTRPCNKKAKLEIATRKYTCNDGHTDVQTTPRFLARVRLVDPAATHPYTTKHCFYATATDDALKTFLGISASDFRAGTKPCSRRQRLCMSSRSRAPTRATCWWRARAGSRAMRRWHMSKRSNSPVFTVSHWLCTYMLCYNNNWLCQFMMQSFSHLRTLPIAMSDFVCGDDYIRPCQCNSCSILLPKVLVLSTRLL